MSNFKKIFIKNFFIFLSIYLFSNIKDKKIFNIIKIIFYINFLHIFFNPLIYLFKNFIKKFFLLLGLFFNNILLLLIINKFLENFKINYCIYFSYIAFIISICDILTNEFFLKKEKNNPSNKKIIDI